jgi:hypothetical protein
MEPTPMTPSPEFMLVFGAAHAKLWAPENNVVVTQSHDLLTND